MDSLALVKATAVYDYSFWSIGFSRMPPPGSWRRQVPPFTLSVLVLVTGGAAGPYQPQAARSACT